MDENNGGRGIGEYVLGSLNDDSDDDCNLESDSTDETKNLFDHEQETLKRIFDLKFNVDALMANIAETTLEQKKEYEKYSEQLLQILIQLDNVETNNFDKVREARKSVVHYVQNCLQELDSKSEQRGLPSPRNGLDSNE